MEDLLKSGSQWRLLWDQLQFLSSSGLQSDWNNWEETQFFLKSKKLIFLHMLQQNSVDLWRLLWLCSAKKLLGFEKTEPQTATGNQNPKKIQGLHIPCAWLFQLHLTFSIKWIFTRSFIKCNSVLCTPIVIFVSNDQVLIFTKSVTYFSSTIILLQLSLTVIFLFILQGTVLFRSCDSIHEL